MGSGFEQKRKYILTFCEALILFDIFGSARMKGGIEFGSGGGSVRKKEGGGPRDFKGI